MFFTLRLFEDKPIMVSSTVVTYCYIDGKREEFAATKDRYKPQIELTSSNESLLKEINIDVSKYDNQEKNIKDIKKYISEHGGKCN